MKSISQPAEVSIELSVVIPCLNEADTLGICLEKAFSVIEKHQLKAEVIVADNGSTDRSVEIAQLAGAQVVRVAEKGYGFALMAGIQVAQGIFIIMGDADDSYDFLEIPKFVVRLREGYELVQGCRLPAGGGEIAPGAMPFTHRWIGNPMFSFLVRWWFKASINDVYCGLRGFTRDFWNELGQTCTGMEFAPEMIIKASLRNARIAEVPITLHRSGRKSHAPHLKTIQDGWKTTRLFLAFAPKWFYLLPGFVLLSLGVAGYSVW